MTYCVLSIATGDILYAGTSQAATAAALDPGTVYGYGRTRHAAWCDAMRRRAAAIKSCRMCGDTGQCEADPSGERVPWREVCRCQRRETAP